MDEQTMVQQSTSILELLYLIKAKNRGEITFEEFMTLASDWAKAVIAEHEAGPEQSNSVKLNGRNEASDTPRQLHRVNEEHAGKVG